MGKSVISGNDELHKKIERLNRKIDNLTKQNKEHLSQIQSLKIKSRKYHSLFDHSDVGIILCCRDEQIFDVNKKALELFECKKSEILKRAISELLSPASQLKFDQIFESARINSPENYETEFIKGNKKLFSARLSLIKIKSGSREFYQLLIRDISDQKKIENTLRNSEKILNSIVRAVPDIIYRLDRDSRILFINDAIREYGYEPHDLIGKNIFDLVHPQDREKSLFRVNERRTGERRTRHFEIRLKAKNRRYVPFDVHATGIFVEPTFLLEAEGLYSSDPPETNSFMGSQGVARDITERKFREKILQESEQKLNAILSSIVDTMLVFDSHKKIISHHCHHDPFYLPKEEFLGKKPDEVLPKNISKIFNTALRATKEGQISEYEYYMQRNGTAKWYSSKFSPSMLNGKFLGSVAVIRDISESKKVEEFIIRKNADQEQLIKIVKYLNESLNLNEVLTRIAVAAKEILKAEGCAIYLLEKDLETLTPVVAIDPEFEYEILQTPLTVHNSFTGKSVSDGKGYIFNHAEEVTNGYQIPGTPENEAENIIVAPFIVDSRVLGAVCLDRKSSLFSEEDLGFVEAFATLAANALKNAKSHSDLEKEIENRKVIQKALRDSEEKFRNLAEQSPNMIFINQNGKVVYANQKCEEIMGFKREEIYAPDFNFLILVAPEHHAWIKDRLQKHQKDEDLSSHEYTLITKDGSRIESLTTTKLIKYEGEDAILGIITDIGDRKRSEEALRRSEEKYRKFFEEDLTGDYISTPDGRLLACNAAFLKIFGFKTSKEAMATNVKNFYATPSDRDKFLERLKKEKKLEYCEIELLRSDGKPVFVIANMSGKFDKKGNLVEIKGYLFDNTEQKILEQQLRQAQKMEAIGRLAGGVAHDFNNLLTIITGYSDLLLHRLSKSDTTLKDIRQIKQAGDKASRLTNQLLAFSRRQVLQPKLINLNAVVKDVSKMLHRIIGEDIELYLEMEPKLGTIKADPGQLEQVIMNLAVNARDAMPQGGQITIETTNVTLREDIFHEHVAVQRAGEYVKLSINDTGIGMDEETQAHIFEPFFTTKPYGKGTGLGLSTVYGIIKQSEGYIWVDSKPEKGTNFNIYFPRILKEAKDLPAPEAELTDLAGKETILLVEDEDMVRDLAVRILEENGYQVLASSRGEKALELSKNFQQAIDLMITDIVMPGMGGKKLAKKIKKDRPDLKVLFISGYTDEIISQQGVLEEGTHFLQKPFLPQKLLSQIREILD
ncbi:MAG: PAS domain S-box protein [bacterium]|nr:MAG: PAS domain S-box protein [bacterium]